MKAMIVKLAALLMVMGLIATNASAALITFDDLITGETTFGFDGDGDGVDDVIFSTTDPLGFNTVGPSANMTFIDEPGLEGTSLLQVDLRVDFLVGAIGGLSFGFALNSVTEDDFASFELYDSSDNLIASTSELGMFTFPDGTNPSSFPEGEISMLFSGVAAYGLFNFTSDFGRYIIDNLEGTFGSTERPVPEPGTLLLFGLGLVGMSLFRRKNKA